MTPSQIQANAKAAGFNVMIGCDAGIADLVLWVRPGTDYDGEFTAICSETGDRLRIMGWNVHVHGEVGRA